MSTYTYLMMRGRTEMSGVRILKQKVRCMLVFSFCEFVLRTHNDPQNRISVRSHF